MVLHRLASPFGLLSSPPRVPHTSRHRHNTQRNRTLSFAGEGMVGGGGTGEGLDGGGKENASSVLPFFLPRLIMRLGV